MPEPLALLANGLSARIQLTHLAQNALKSRAVA